MFKSSIATQSDSRPIPALIIVNIFLTAKPICQILKYFLKYAGLIMLYSNRHATKRTAALKGKQYNGIAKIILQLVGWVIAHVTAACFATKWRTKPGIPFSQGRRCSQETSERRFKLNLSSPTYAYIAA